MGKRKLQDNLLGIDLRGNETDNQGKRKQSSEKIFTIITMSEKRHN